jgi:hypothetical protein
MKLVFIYGAPGVGKLTTAKALAALTGFRIFHNHLSFDLAKAVFDFPTPPFRELAEKVRLATFEAAARAKVPGLVFTFVYASPDDDAFVEKTIRTVEGNEGSLAFVRLYCDAATLEKRVAADERRQFGKITSALSLRAGLARWNLTAAIPFRESLEIDNSALEAAEAARRIAAHFSLTRAAASPPAGPEPSR